MESVSEANNQLDGSRAKHRIKSVLPCAFRHWCSIRPRSGALTEFVRTGASDSFYHFIADASEADSACTARWTSWCLRRGKGSFVDRLLMQK